jgi:hypothetical protein
VPGPGVELSPADERFPRSKPFFTAGNAIGHPPSLIHGSRSDTTHVNNANTSAPLAPKLGH